MYLCAGVFSLGLLLLSRVLGLLRESDQAAAFGSTGMGDAVIVMITLPDLLVGILISGALSYVLLPAWAQQSPSQQAAGQRKIAVALVCTGLVLGALVLLIRSSSVEGLAPGLVGDIKIESANALGWSALALALAMLAALWVTWLQHERDFVGMYAGNLIVNLALVIGLFVVANGITPATYVLSLLGICLDCHDRAAGMASLAFASQSEACSHCTCGQFATCQRLALGSALVGLAIGVSAGGVESGVDCG